MRYHTSVQLNTTEHLLNINSMSCASLVSKHIKKICHIREDWSKQQAQLGPDTDKLEATIFKKKIFFLHFALHTNHTVNKLWILTTLQSPHTEPSVKTPLSGLLDSHLGCKRQFLVSHHTYLYKDTSRPAKHTQRMVPAWTSQLPRCGRNFQSLSKLRTIAWIYSASPFSMAYEY